MKKIALLLLFSFLLIIGLSGAQTCEQLNVNVCGTTPNSAIGYGAVDICNTCYPCGVADGVCPEDFYSTVSEIQGSCRNCPDVDCTAMVEGTVRSIHTTLIQGAKIYVTHAGGQSPLQDASGNDVLTDINGHYGPVKATAGLVTFHASYSDYDTDIVSKEIFRGSTANVVDITVSPGACNSNCTDIFGTVCKASCQGMNGCQFTDGRLLDGSFLPSPADIYTQEVIAERCDGFTPGTTFPVYGNTTDIVYAQCCNGGTIVEPRPTLVTLEDGPNECIDNLGTHVIKAKYKGKTVRVVVKSWMSTC